MSKQKFNPIQTVEDDGLPSMEVGNWVQKKYKLVGKYCDIFTSGMKNHWNLVYLDLFSGSGHVQNKSSGAFLRNAALISLTLPRPFDHYVFNDYNEESAKALTIRVERDFPERSFEVFNEDANHVVDKMFNSIPRFQNDKGDLHFSFLDPFSLNLNFDTIVQLGERQVDILILHALQMDARRNWRRYLSEENNVVASFTGSIDWRDKFLKQEQSAKNFMTFVTEEFDSNIRKIGYQPASEKVMIRNNQGNGIYYLCFYSKHPRGREFFDKIRKTGNDQYEMF